MTRGVVKYIFVLLRQAKGGSRGFRLAAFLDADLSQLFAEIGGSVAVVKVPLAGVFQSSIENRQFRSQVDTSPELGAVCPAGFES